jgi:hypothetical protein
MVDEGQRTTPRIWGLVPRRESGLSIVNDDQRHRYLAEIKRIRELSDDERRVYVTIAKLEAVQLAATAEENKTLADMAIKVGLGGGIAATLTAASAVAKASAVTIFLLAPVALAGLVAVVGMERTVTFLRRPRRATVGKQEREILIEVASEKVSDDDN